MRSHTLFVSTASPALNIYKINELFLVTLCYGLWELISNWLIWNFLQKKAFHLCALLIYAEK